MNRPHRIFALITLFSVLGALLSAPAAAADPRTADERQVDGVAAPNIDWKACGDFAPGFDCATVAVPLDYDRPEGPSISLALTRMPATDPAHRIGSVFMNPGGPGASGVSYLWRFIDRMYPPAVRARFDIISFDPRGVARSTPLQCFATPEDAAAVLTPFPFPYTADEERQWHEADRAYADACRRTAGPIIDHMSTANVARDMDLLRRSVGDARMTFDGGSYGSYVGATYANMFPSRVRAVVIDGIIDPVSFATGRGHEARYLPVDVRLRSDQGAYESLLQFFALCKAGGPNCAFSDGDPKARYDALAQRLLAAPAQLPEGPYTYNDLVWDTLGALYDENAFPELAELLQALDTGADPAAARRSLRADVPEELPYPQVMEGLIGVTCVDTDNPDSPALFAAAARDADRKWPYFGRAWGWTSSMCTEWPGRDTDRYAGPFNRRTANDVLVVGSRYDPATRYQDAVSTAAMLPRSTLVTMEGWGHTAASGSSCVDAIVARYLLEAVAPAVDTTCQPDKVPFAEPAVRSASPDGPAHFGPPTVRRTR
ncbi:hydrolase [Virgisporangium aliadipatigenens]|uniref:Hydrolase n=1 Tax=Virgisporangium aliadipatigenens TaxID=741659 RepID=A0A8J3YPV0_9ACTN|nr:alpha/beta hydrolase [Virgisporangium aliadipatigenens]GIJ48277.1 hydrolase [Virgisporangium aliadipatigenens]